MAKAQAQINLNGLGLQLPSSSGSSAPPTPRRPLTPAAPPTGIVVFSGGSAANNLVDVFESVREANQCTLSYVIPISDNGGSSSEIIRVFGGPEWFEILEATHPLWNDISSPKRELIRSYLNSFNLEVVKRMKPSSRFDYSGASIGNLFLTGARLFTGSFEAAIYLLSSICSVPDRIAVLPALNTNFASHIAAGLEDGTIITGQNDISHPSAPTAAVPGASAGVHSPTVSRQEQTWDQDHHHVEDANLPGTLPALRRPAIAFSKEQEEDLPARIARVWYINPYGEEIKMPANPRVLDALRSVHSVVYSIGSLFTSLIPSLVLRGVGDAIVSPQVRNKILILNGTTDRETGPSTAPFTGLDFVGAIANALADSRGLPKPTEEEYSQYVSHVIYIEGPTSPKVDKPLFTQLGIDATRLYGPKDEKGRGGRYDAKALTQALETIIGRKDARSDRSRRNTLVG
ncbi:UPF0052 domain-containing protein [Fusarium denticulatum]|uniref:UPF0052 domain-containing protein n=1 Tax=Fusarium denticulatum TaxID=48507 RepID=A0A8H5TZQ2_9HYPO|nr:UPF0052 domain-containing protein [Fusarium denticulatum]